VVYDHPNLQVRAASPERMLATKAGAARPTDDADIVVLADRLGLRTAAEVAAVHQQLFPDDPLGGRPRARLGDLLG